MKTKQEVDQQLDGNSPRPPAPPTDEAQPHAKQVEAMRVFEQVQRNRNMGMSINIAHVASSLKQAEPRAYFPESLFVEYFLPLFADEKPATPEINIATWIEKVAGGEQRPVDILDENSNVLFTVPPIFDLSVLEQSKPGGASMTRVERHYSRLKEIDALASQTFLSKTLQGMHIKEEPTQQVYANMKTWNDIFRRYGKEDKIINLLKLENDPNQQHLGGSPGSATVSESDLTDFQLDTD